MERNFLLIFSVTLVSALGIATSAVAAQVSHPIDTNHIILISDLVSTSPSYFGYSTILIPAETGTETGWIIISAPTGNSSEVYKDVQEPGVLWRCSLGKQNGQKEACIVLPIDPIDSRIGKLVCSANRCRNEKRDKSWFGMTLIGNSERVVACVPKWKRGFKNDNYKLNGLCYWLPIEVIVSEPFSIEPYEYAVQRLVPLVNQSLQVVDRLPVWSVAQAGFSAHLTTDNDLFLGAPGVNGWNGSVIRYQDNWTSVSGTRERLNRKNQTEFSKYSVLQTELSQLFYDLEYFGYAVTQGRYFNLPDDAEVSETLIAASSPRGSSLLGLVFVFEFPENEYDLWLPFQTVQGDQFGAYFGAVLLSADMNGDGLDELLVSAPFRSANRPKKPFNDNDGNSEDSSTQDIRSGDEGCVFVYSAKEKLDQFGDPDIICGSNSFGARFGSTIASLEDINADGFKDIAIAAPFENDSEGAVYIYHGKASFGINKGIPVLHALKITPSSLRLSLKGFGSSIFGSVDIDGNKTPDIAIGSCLSQNVLVLRTRHKVSFESKIETILNGELLEKLKLDVDQFVVRSCTRISQLKQPFLSDKTIDISIKLQLDPHLQRFEILSALANETDRAYTYTNYTVVYKDKVSVQNVACAEWNVGIIGEIDTVSLHPIPFTILQEVTYEENVHRTRSVRTYDIVDGSVLKLGGAEFDEFCANCPSTTIVSTEYSLPLALDNCDEDGDPKCKTDLRLEIKLRYLDSTSSIDEYILGSPLTLTLVITLHNSKTAETAYFPVVELSWSNSPIFPEDDSRCQYISELTPTADALIRCKFGDMLQRNETQSLILMMKTNELYAQQRSSTIHFSATAYPAKDPIAAKVRQNLKANLKADVKGMLLGSAENSTFSNDQYTKITQTFKVFLKGQSSVDHARMSFWFPIKTLIAKIEKQVLFVIQPQGSTCRVISKNGKFSIAESDKLLVDTSQRTRIYRAPQSPDKRKEKQISFEAIGSERRKVFKKHLVQELRCEDSQDSRCLRVECDSRKFERNSVIEVQFRLYVDNELTKNLMLKNDRPILHIQTIGSLRILENDIMQMEMASTFLHDYSIEPEEPIGIWIYIVSGIMGFLLLALLIFLLIRCGFFQRALKRKWDALKTPKGVVMEEPEFWGRWQYSQIYRSPS